MGLRKTLKKLIKNNISEDMFNDVLGLNFFEDVKRLAPGKSMDVIFDVGANVGQSAVEISKYCPNAQVHCFEPISKTFQQLKKTTSELENVQCHNFALGNQVCQSRMTAEGVSSKNHVVSDSDSSSKTEEVDVITLDEFCQKNEIKRISFLKIDTEGFDLEVLKGADEMLKARKIDFVEVEAGMTPLNDYHVPMEDFKSHLEELGYYLFGIYEQTSEWRLKEKHLRRANLVFMLSESNT